MTRARFGSTRGRYRSIGGDTFTSTPTPTCPAGQHWVDPPAAAIRGLGGCVPDVVHVTLRPLALRPPPAAAPPPPPPLPPMPPAVFAPPPPTGGDFAPAPTLAPAIVCPPLWPWWWLLVAGGIGVGLGVYMQQNQKAAKKNLGRVANAAGGRIINSATHAAVGRLLG